MRGKRNLVAKPAKKMNQPVKKSTLKSKPGRKSKTSSTLKNQGLININVDKLNRFNELKKEKSRAKGNWFFLYNILIFWLILLFYNIKTNYSPQFLFFLSMRLLRNWYLAANPNCCISTDVKLLSWSGLSFWLLAWPSGKYGRKYFWKFAYFNRKSAKT